MSKSPPPSLHLLSQRLGLVAAAGCALMAQPVAAQQGNVSNVQQQAPQVTVTRGGSDARVSQDTGTAASRNVQQSLRQRASEQSRVAGQVRQRAQQAVLMPGAQPSAALAQAGAAGAGVDERPLWQLLQRKDLRGFDQQLARLRAQGGWTPTASLLAERERQQADLDIEQGLAQVRRDPARAGALDQLLALVEHYPAQFSCERIDHLWSAAELFARGGDRAQALALYRSVFPGCSPAENRIATLYMAQQVLGADSPEVTQLILAEAPATRDEASDARFQRLVYDRQLSHLAALDPAGDEALASVAPLSEAIRGYQDGAAGALAGWIMLAHNDLAEAAVWFNRVRQWQPANVDAQLGLLQIRLAAGDIAGAETLLALPGLAADPRARAQRARLQMLRADRLNRAKDFSASLAALDEAQRLGATDEQTASLRAWNLYGSGRYEQASQLFARQYRSTHEAPMAEGWALAESARGQLGQLAVTPEAQQAPLADYVMAMQSQQLYYRKQFGAAYVLQQRVQANAGAQDDGGTLRDSVASYLPSGLDGVTAASITAGFTYANHAGASGQGHLETFAPQLRADWFGGERGSREYSLRWRGVQLDAGTLSPDRVARALGEPATDTQSGKVTVQELWFGAKDAIALDDGRALTWQAAVGAAQGGAGGGQVYGQGSVGMQAATASWSVYAGSNPVRDSLLSWRGTTVPNTGGLWWGDVRRNTLGANGLFQVAPRWSVSANAEVASLRGHHVQDNSAVGVDLGAGYDLKLAGFDYFNVGPALHYLHYDHNQNEYSWGLGGYYSPQRSVSTGIASQFMTPEGRQWQVAGNVELGYNQSSQSAAACLPVGGPSLYRPAPGFSCGYAGSSDSGMYSHLQLSLVKRLAPRWQLGVLGDLNVTPGRDRQYATMLFVRYFFEDRAAVFSRDLPKTTRDFSGPLDDGR